MALMQAIVHFPPVYPELTRPSLVLFGTIEKDPTNNWASNLSTALLDLPIQILNPRRDDWDSTWREEVSFTPFRENVEWEMSHAEKVTLLVFCFKAGSLCPITLLELGMHAARFGDHTVVCCEEGFYKRRNVEIACSRFGVPFMKTTEELQKLVRSRMEALCESDKVS